MEWEGVKENMAPVKRGRALGRPMVDVAALEAAVATGGVAAWVAYIRGVEEAYPCDPGRAVDVRERCARALKDDAQYRNDPRYVGVWLDYIDALARPAEAFRYLHKKKIGDSLSIFWVAWALSAETDAKFKLAADLYDRGLAKNAQPIDLLNNRRAAFLVRDAQRDREEAPPPDAENQRRPLARASGRAPRPARVPTPASTSTVAVFVDDDLRQQPGIDDDLDTDDWPDFGTRLGRSKENSQLPSRWTDASIGARRPAIATKSSVDIFVDSELREDFDAATTLRARDQAQASRPRPMMPRI